jgi:hypothetical protein
MKHTITALIATLALTSTGRANSLPNLLDVAAKSAEREMAALSSVACTETVVETKVNQKNKTEERRRQTFDYLVLADTEDGNLALTESRIEQGKTKTESKPLLASTGFATMMLILHPVYQNSFEFSDLGVIDEGGRTWRRLGFEFRPGKRSPSLLRTGTREFPLAWKGEVLLDEVTGQVSSIHAGLGSQLEEIGLLSLEATVHYGPQPGHTSADWLPTEAVIDLKTNHQHWHNIHTFASYKRFDVVTTEKREAVKQ